MAKIIVATGYFSTGSSAVVDFFKDIDGVLALDADEVRFVQDPNGISDLEYNLIENNHRHNSSNSIKLFLREVERLEKRKKGFYYKMFNGQFKRLAKNYINYLIDFSFRGYNHLDVNNLSGFSKAKYKFKKRVGKLFRFHVGYNYLPEAIDYCLWPSEDYFLNKTNEFLYQLTEAAVGNTGADYVVYDQLIPASNVERYYRYIQGSKIIIVNRDPRDIFVETKIKRPDHIVPLEVEKFCKWYLNTRLHNQQNSNDHVLIINFEDLVLKFEETSKKLCDFVGMKEYVFSNHVCRHFNPSISKNNVCLYKRFPEISNDIEYIENHLATFLYSKKEEMK